MRDFIHIEKDRIEFTDSRFYKHFNGNYYPSVTTILDAYPKSAAFFEWLKKQGEDADEVRDEAGRKGSTVHQLCEDYDNGKEICILNPRGEAQYKQIEWSMTERYVEFREKFTEFELVANELHYISADLGYAGTLDRVFKCKGKNILVDLKTSNALHNHYWLQMAAYKSLWDEVNPQNKIDEIRILWLNAKTRTAGKEKDIQGVGWQLKEPDNSIEYYYRLFNNVFETWKEENKTTKPRNATYQLKHKLNSNGEQKINSQIGNLQEIV